jgi:hypothetical protein
MTLKYVIPPSSIYRDQYHPLIDYFTGRFLDRSKQAKLGFQYHVRDQLPTSMPANPGDFDFCMDERAKQIKLAQEEAGKPLALLWSGGWDSTSIAVALIKAGLKFKVIYTESSMMENPNFYRDVLVNCSSIEMEQVKHPLRWLHFDGPDYVIVTGECGAQMMGTISFRKILVGMNKSFHNISEGVDESFTEFMSNPEPLYKWPDYYKNPVKHVLDYYPGTLKTNYDAMWWVTFVFKWQVVQYRMELFSGKIQPDMHHYFLCPLFEAWSMNNDATVKCPEYKWENYKLPMKDYIFKFQGNEDVYELQKYASMQLAQPEIRYGVYQNRYIYLDENNQFQLGH